jgi:hypothetical protein
MRWCTMKYFIGCALKMGLKSPKKLLNAPKVPQIKHYFLFFLVLRLILQLWPIILVGTRKVLPTLVPKLVRIQIIY